MNTSLVFGVALVVSAPALKDPPRNPRDIVGEWVVESVTVRGQERPSSNLNYIFTKDGKWIIHRDDKETPNVNRVYKCNPRAFPPTLELIASSNGGAAGPREGIYKLDGDKLTMCVAASGNARPEKFESTADNGQTIYVLKRKKK
jgi:uncharacterized protein (TIGR03067 family)